MLSFQTNINEFNKIKRKVNKLRKNLILKKTSARRQDVLPTAYGLNVILPTEPTNNLGYLIKNTSDTYDLIISDNPLTVNFTVRPGNEFAVMYNGTEWIQSNEFINYIQLPIQLTKNFDNHLGYGDYVEHTVGDGELEEVIPETEDLEKVKFRPIYPEIKIILWFAQYNDKTGEYVKHTNEFSSSLPFQLDTEFFDTSYLQLNYYSGDSVQGNSLIDYKQYFFSDKWLYYIEDDVALPGDHTSMLVQKPYDHSYNLNITNYYFYYYIDSFNDTTLYFNGEFKNTKTGKSQLFTTTEGGIVTDSEGSIDKNKLYSTIKLKRDGGNFTYSFDDIDYTNNQLNFYEVIS